MNPKIKAYLQQLNFYLGRNPKVQKLNNWRQYIPEPYKAVVVISADFELSWAWQYAKNSPDPLAQASHKARLERENMPNILALCEKYNIPVTWLTVGHLFLDSCAKANGIPHPELPQLPHFENDYWKYAGNDWFENDPCTNYNADPLWYCPDLIEKIVNSKVNHEIGCHTFSHIDCRDSICSPVLFRAEIESWFQASRGFDIGKTESFVHPGHTIGNLDALVELGFTSYRTDNANILGYPRRHANGLWEFSTTLELDYFPDWTINAQINRYITILKRALRHNCAAYFWFHPSFDPLFTQHILPTVFEWLNRHREEIWIVNKGEYVRWLNSR